MASTETHTPTQRQQAAGSSSTIAEKAKEVERLQQEQRETPSDEDREAETIQALQTLQRVKEEQRRKDKERRERRKSIHQLERSLGVGDTHSEISRSNSETSGHTHTAVSSSSHQKIKALEEELKKERAINESYRQARSGQASDSTLVPQGERRQSTFPTQDARASFGAPAGMTPAQQFASQTPLEFGGYGRQSGSFAPQQSDHQVQQVGSQLNLPLSQYKQRHPWANLMASCWQRFLLGKLLRSWRHEEQEGETGMEMDQEMGMKEMAMKETDTEEDRVPLEVEARDHLEEEVQDPPEEEDHPATIQSPTSKSGTRIRTGGRLALKSWVTLIQRIDMLWRSGQELNTSVREGSTQTSPF
ncbi:unnamed protein product [Tilletia caries]|nr:unnamed protein product [Tilletia caries]CAD6949068.1 unnamed protein product [Tilletia controversa]